MTFGSILLCLLFVVAVLFCLSPPVHTARTGPDPESE